MKCNPVKLVAIAISFSQEDKFFTSVAEDFNEYANKNDLNVELEVILRTFTNSSDLAHDYRSEMEYLLKKGSNKYDIYFYDITYSTKYHEYLMDITDILPEEHKSWYSSGVAPQTCILDGRWVGLVSKKVLILYQNIYIYNIILKTI